MGFTLADRALRLIGSHGSGLARAVGLPLALGLALCGVLVAALRQAPATLRWPLLAAVLVLSATVATGAATATLLEVPAGGRRARSLLLLAAIRGVVGLAATVALVLPGVRIALAHRAAPAALLSEGGTVGDALRRSRGLLAGRSGGVVVGDLALTLLGGSALGGLCCLGLLVLRMPPGGSAPVAALRQAGLLTLALGVAVPLRAAASAAAYLEACDDREGRDLLLAARRLRRPADDPVLGP